MLPQLRLEITVGNWHYGTGLVRWESPVVQETSLSRSGWLKAAQAAAQMKPTVSEADMDADPRKDAKFCRACGSELVGRIEAEGYDTKTGEPMHVAFAACPNATFPRNARFVEGQRYFCDDDF